MNDRVLPIGSVVTLKGNPTRLMIVGYIAQSKDDGKIYHYCACYYPQGLDEEQQVLFNTDDIDVVFFVGYQNKKSLFSTKLIKECIDRLDRGESIKKILDETLLKTMREKKKDGESNE